MTWFWLKEWTQLVPFLSLFSPGNMDGSLETESHMVETVEQTEKRNQAHNKPNFLISPGLLLTFSLQNAKKSNFPSSIWSQVAFAKLTSPGYKER